MPSGCLTDDVLVDLLECRLTPEMLAYVHQHVAVCSSCHEEVIELVRGDPVWDAGDAGPAPDSGFEETGTQGSETTHLSDLVPPQGQEGHPHGGGGVWTPPSAFDEFRLLRELGRGGMGVVYLAQDLNLDRLVAIKFIAASHPSEEARARFTDEARAIARLKHPNVMTVHRVGEVEGRPYLVSEYVLGKRLSDESLPMPWRRVFSIGRSLARGLGAAHRQGVLHRDIKPANVMMEGDAEVKLLDFGLAEAVDHKAHGASKDRVIAGTPRYMAPEVLQGKAATPQSDIYSLGLVLYELCTGRVPRRRRELPPGTELVGTAGGVADAIALPNEEGGPLAESVPGIDPDFAALVERCLRSEPIERFASVEALQENLDRLDGTALGSPLPTGNPYRGLHPFEAEHRAYFFGRNAEIRAVIERLRQEPLILVAGDSGAGKSSLCRAGILPRIAEGALDGGQREFTIISLWPGRRPLEALAAALAPVLGKTEAELKAELMDTAGVSRLGERLREFCRDRRGVILFVDQLEELLTLSDAAGAARFAEFLGELALPAPGMRVLLAVRGDFFTRLVALRELGDNIQRALYLLRPLSPEGVREAIVGPARNQGVVFESEALITMLMDSMEQGAGGLPLLQFALAELWERRDKASGRITRASLEAMGGVEGALSRHADAVLAQLGPDERRVARRVLIRLVTEEGTGIARTEAELSQADEPARTAVRALLEGRLLHTAMIGGEVTYQIAHEALIKGWATLGNWLDEDIGYRAIRLRIEAASAEWARIGQSSDALWNARQLDETRPLDVTLLGPREHAFLEASHQVIRRKRILRWLVRIGGFVVPFLLVIGSYTVVRVQRHFSNEQFIGEQMKTAQAALAEGKTYSAKASEVREQALAVFDGRAIHTSSDSSEDSWEEAEKVWADALQRMEKANIAYARADQALAIALLRDSSHRDARQLQAELTYERILMAERFYQSQQLGDHMRLLERLDEDHQWRRRLMAPAELSIKTTPLGARVTIMRYVQVPDQGLRHLETVPGLGNLGTTPIGPVQLPPGSYLLKFTLPGHAPVELPILLERGEGRRVEIPLPTSVPEDYVYVPPGDFQFGCGDFEGQRKFVQAIPLHRIHMSEGYLIGRTEVTVRDWLAYLNALPENAPTRRYFVEPRLVDGGMLLLRQERGGGWSYSFSASQESATWSPARREGELFRYPGRSRRAEQDWRQFPMVGVSPVEFQDYLRWLDRSGRLPGARLCREDEWERAARGADDRRYPHGDRLLPDDANIDATYGWKLDAFGPDAVGAHPASMSPFGLLDMAGNVLELMTSIRPEPGRFIMRGGAWYYDAATAAPVFTRTPTEANIHDVRIGLRVCAPPR